MEKLSRTDQKKTVVQENTAEQKKSIDQKAYPQFVVGENADSSSAAAKRDLSSFRNAPAVQNRPGQLQAVTRDKNGVTFHYAVRARQSQHSYTHETSLYLYKNAESETGSLDVRIELWREDIFRVTMTSDSPYQDFFAGLPKEYQMLIARPCQVTFTLTETADDWLIETEKLAIHVEKANGRITAYQEGRLCYAQCRSEFKAADIFDQAVSTLQENRACFEALELDYDELIYGLGERFEGMVRNGKPVDFYNKDAVGTTSRRTYVNIPFYISTKGYGLFLNSGAQTSWEIGTEDSGALQFAVWEPQMDYFVIADKTPKEILAGYCFLTGFSKLPPLWSFGLWMSRNSYTSWEVVDEIASQVRAHDIPCDVLHLDTAWFTTDWNCDLQFSRERFPEPQKHIEALKKDGFHISLWQYNFIPPRNDNENYLEAAANGYLAKNDDGETYQLPESCKGSWVEDTILDFSNPDTCKWYGDKIRALMKQGAGAIKTDFGEGIPVDAHYQNIEGCYFHNLYSLVYNAVVFEASRSVTGENLVWARSGTAGSQRYPIHWGGDSQCSFEALAATLRAALCVGMSGIPFFSHDIGGFIGLPEDELYVRWAQLGLFSSHSRCHGAGDRTWREPWRFSEEACSIFRRYAKLRYSLMPYIYSQAEACVKTGLPMMRALYLEYPEDRNVWNLDSEYLFGSQLLIAPVLRPLAKSTVREVYLPKGVWYDYFTQERYDSAGMWIQKPVTLETLPIYVKQGTTLEYCEKNTTLAQGMGKIVRTETWNDEMDGMNCKK